MAPTFKKIWSPPLEARMVSTVDQNFSQQAWTAFDFRPMRKTFSQFNTTTAYFLQMSYPNEIRSVFKCPCFGLYGEVS
jgi:hypothetical protein